MEVETNDSGEKGGTLSSKESTVSEQTIIIWEGTEIIDPTELEEEPVETYVLIEEKTA